MRRWWRKKIIYDNTQYMDDTVHTPLQFTHQSSHTWHSNTTPANQGQWLSGCPVFMCPVISIKYNITETRSPGF